MAPSLPEGLALTSLLDDGGQGVVYRGTANGAQAAIKLYLPGQVEKRVAREAAALGDIDCPSIVRLLHYSTIHINGQELPLVATEFIEGESLKDALANRGPLEGEELSILAYDVASAISAMWAKRIVHRDLKPGNVLIRPSGRACVIDLGLARHLDESSLTAVGYTWGTRGYLSPEQAKGARALTCHSDVYALGVLLLEAAEGKHPTARDQNELLKRPFHETLVPELTSWSCAYLARRMLDTRPNCRPSPREIMNALRNHAPTHKVSR